MRLRFGDFEIDMQGYELRRNGRPVRLERQPMDLLMLLLERPHDVVTREEISRGFATSRRLRWHSCTRVSAMITVDCKWDPYRAQPEFVALIEQCAFDVRRQPDSLHLHV